MNPWNFPLNEAHRFHRLSESQSKSGNYSLAVDTINKEIDLLKSLRLCHSDLRHTSFMQSVESMLSSAEREQLVLNARIKHEQKENAAMLQQSTSNEDIDFTDCKVIACLDESDTFLKELSSRAPPRLRSRFSSLNTESTETLVVECSHSHAHNNSIVNRLLKSNQQLRFCCENLLEELQKRDKKVRELQKSVLIAENKLDSNLELPPLELPQFNLDG